MKIIFVNRFFYPDVSATSQMLSDQVFALSGQGLNVEVITSRYGYSDKAQCFASHENIDGVSVHRVWTTNFGRAGLIARAIDYVSFLLSASWHLLRLVRAGDIVVAKTDPPILSAFVFLICALREAKLVNWLQDLFPEAATTLGVGGSGATKLAFALLGGLRNVSLRAARANVVIGGQMARRVEALGVDPARIVMIPNWANGRLIYSVPHEANTLRRKWGLGDAWVIMHSGNLGRAHDYRTILSAIEELENGVAAGALQAESVRQVYPSRGGAALAVAPVAEAFARPIRWLFVGGGVGFETLRREVEERNLTSVVFQDYQSRERLAESLSCADVHLVTLRAEMEGLSVPSKVYGAMASGRPVVFVGDKEGEVARILRRSDCGFSVGEGDGAGLVDALLKLATDSDLSGEMGGRARRVLEADYELELAVARWRRLLDKVASEP